MEIKKVTQEMRNKLREPLPKEAVTKHPTKTYLSSIKAIYVVERLNDVFGVGCWYQTSEIIKDDSKMIIVKSFLKIPEYGIELEAFGGNDNADTGDAYKGAATDALTKMCSYLEIGIEVFKGLADNQETKQETPVIWLTKEQFEKALNSDLKGLKATISFYSSATHKMSKTYLEQLTAKLKQLE